MATDHNFKVKNGLTVQGETLVVNHTGDLSGTQVYIKRLDGNNNLQRWGEGTSGQSTYRFRIDQNFIFIGNSGSGDTIQIRSDNGAITTPGNITISSNSTGLITRQILARDTNGLSLKTTGGTEALAINNSANATFAGTIASGAINASGQITQTVAGSNYFRSIASSSGNAGLYMQNTARNWFVLNNSAGTFEIYDGTASATRMSINTSGNTTFSGTISSGALTSSGTITSTDGSGTLVISGDSSSNNYLASAGEFRFRPSGTTVNKFVIGSNGNLTTAGTISSGAISSGAITSTGTSTFDRITDSNRKGRYTSISGSSGDWFPILQLSDSGNGPVTVQMNTYAHSTVTFVAGHGYTASNSAYLTVLGANYNANSGYANVSGLRIKSNGLVEAKLVWSSGPTVDIDITVTDANQGTIQFPSSLATTTDTNNVQDSHEWTDTGRFGARKVNALSSILLGGTEIVNSSRNLTNIGTISSGALTVTSSDTSTFAGTDYLNINANVGNVNTNGSHGLHIGWNKSNGGREINMIFDGGTTQADTEMIFTSTDGTNYSDIFQINGAGNVDIKNGGLRIGTTTVIDSSRNLSNIASLTSSGRIMTTQESANSLKSRFLMGKDTGNTNDGDLYINYGTSHDVYIGAGGGSSDLVTFGHIQQQNAKELRGKDTSGNVKTLVRVNGSNELEYGWSGAGPVKFMGGGSYTERMRVHTNGNIGIGTTSPGSKLHIASGAAPADDLTLLTLENGNSTGDIGTPDTFIDFKFTDANSNVTPQARIGAHAGDGTDANAQVLEGKGYLTFHTSNTTNTSGTEAPPERVRITHDGKVGIGTSSPGTELEIGNSSASPTLTLNKSATGESAIDFDNGGNIKAKIALNSAETLQFKTGGSSALRMQITEAGVISFGNNAYSFPTSDGSNGQVLQTDGSGNLTFATVSGGGNATTLDSVAASNYARTDIAETFGNDVSIGTSGSDTELNVKYGQIVGGFGARTTGGTTDWNHSTNARSGNGRTLLLGNATNGPGSSHYYHPFTFEYAAYNSGNNMTQLAIPYSEGRMWFRSRYSNNWTGWREIWNSANDGAGSGLDADNLDGYTWGSYTKSVASNNFLVEAGDGKGLRFWNGQDSYSIYMSQDGASGAGRVFGDTTSDYNMYFRMTAGTNRGFAFQSGTSTPHTGIDSTGNLRAGGVISSGNKQAINCAHWGQSGTSTGAIKITLPGAPGSVYSMPIIEVATYDYSSKAHVIYRISGHNWSTPSNWYQSRVTAEGGPPLTVRLGRDGTNNYVIIIGDTNTSWSYGHATVSLLAHPSFYNTAQNFTSGWGISQVTSLPTEVTVQSVGKLWHSLNDGSGSGLDADTLDGVQASSFLRSDATDSASGTLNLTGRVNIGDNLTRPAALNSDSAAHLKVGASDVHLYVASLNSTGGYKVAVQAARDTDFASFTLNLQSNGGGLQRGGNTVWDAGNDGSGSGLDADTLDGVQLANIARTDTAETFTSNVGVEGNLYIGPGSNDGRFFSDTSGRTAFADGDFYIQNSVTNSYNYATNQYIGDSSGDNIYFRGNVLSGTGWSINGAGKFSTRDIQLEGGYVLMRSTHQSGHMEGGHNNIGNTSTKTSPIYTIGSSYNPNESTLGNMYGIGYSHINASFINVTGGSGWGMYVASDGDARIFLDAENGTVHIPSNGAYRVGSNIVWHAGNDGAGSGLDADLFEGQQGTYYHSQGSTGLAGANRISSTTDFNNSLPSGFYQSSNASNMPGSSWHNMLNVRHSNTANDHGFQLSMSYYNNDLYSRSYQGGSGSNNGNFQSWAKQWSVLNDGAGSGLDADLLDGQQGSYYYPTSGGAFTGATTHPTILFSGVGGNSGNGISSYGLYQEAGAWSNPFPDLILGYHTGVKIGGYFGYNGTRFYNDHPDRSGATEIFSIGKGDNHARLAGSCKLLFNNSSIYGIGAGGHNYNSGYFDTLESGSSSDPLELVYYQGNRVNIGNGGGTKPLGCSQVIFGNTTSRSISHGVGNNSANAVLINGNWNAFECMGRVIDVTGSNCHFMDGYGSTNHASHYLSIGANNGGSGGLSYMIVGTTLRVSGDVIAYYSDGRLKQNVKEIPNALDIVKNIRGVTYEWNKLSESVWSKKEGDKDFGLISQEVEAVFPMGVVVQGGTDVNREMGYADPESENYDPLHDGTKDEVDYKTVKYDKMVAVAIQAIKEQQVMIEELQEEIKELKKCITK